MLWLIINMMWESIYVLHIRLSLILVVVTVKLGINREAVKILTNSPTDNNGI